MKRIAIIVAALAAVMTMTGTGLAQTPADSASETGLLPLIPADAVFFLERRGHEAIKPAFEKSNFGLFCRDEAIAQMITDSRQLIIQMIVAEWFKPEEERQFGQYDAWFQDAIRPFWHCPSALFLAYDPDYASDPGMGLLCMTGKYERPARLAIGNLMKLNLDPEGTDDGWQEFTCKTGPITWQGVAKPSWMYGIARYQATVEGLDYDDETKPPFKLETDPDKLAEQLKKCDVLMVSWQGPLLCVADDLSAARALGKTFSESGAGKDASPAVKNVLAKTSMKDWAFRWHVDIERIVKIQEARGDPVNLSDQLLAIHIDSIRDIRGVGGAEGYIDNVSAGRAFVDWPDASDGLLGAFQAGGSYAKALPLVPAESVVFVAAQADTAALARIRKRFGADQATSRPSTNPDEPASQADSQSAGWNRGTAIAAFLGNFAAASDGNVAGFAVDLQSIVAAGELPLGLVVGVKDKALAQKAMEQLVAEFKAAMREAERVTEDEYRGVKVLALSTDAMAALMDDRFILATNNIAIRAAIDAALDKNTGLAPDGDAARLAKLAGDGAAIAVIDIPAIVRLAWPFLVEASQEYPGDFPLASLPSAAKMVRLLTPEVMVFRPDKDGLMLESRGTVPFGAKLIPTALPLYFMAW